MSCPPNVQKDTINIILYSGPLWVNVLRVISRSYKLVYFFFFWGGGCGG